MSKTRSDAASHAQPATSATRPERVAPPRLGFIGAGWIGRHRMSGLLESGAASAAMIYEPDAANLKAAREIAPAAEIATSLTEALAADIDGVVIATPTALHAEQCLAALEAGLPVFCQKPLGRCARETRAVIDAARKADALIDIDLSYRFTRGARLIRDRVQSGDIGRVYAAELVFHNAYGPDKPWYYDRRLSGGGCALDLGVHLVDLALWTLGFPRPTQVDAGLFSRGARFDPAGDGVEDYAVARVDLDSGAALSLTCSWNLHAGCDAVIGARFHGTDGSLALSNVAGSFYDFQAERLRGSTRERLADPPDAWGARAALDWAGRLARSRRFDPAIATIISVSETLDAIYAAAAERSRPRELMKEA